MRSGLLKVAFATAIVVLTNACQPYQPYVYVTNLVSLSAYTQNSASGALTPTSGFPFADPASPLSLALTGSYLYVTNEANTVSGYQINSGTGALTPVPGSPFATGHGPVSIGIDPSSSFVYVVNEVTNNVSVFKVNSGTGTLTEISGSPFPAGYRPRFIVTGLQGLIAQYAYVGTLNGILGYSVNVSTGALTPIPGSPFGQGEVDGMAINPSGTFLYAVNAVGGNVSGYAIDCSSGALVTLPGSPFAGSASDSLAIDPSGHFLYITSPRSEGGAAYAIGWTGALAPISAPLPPGALDNAVDLTIDPSGFVYVPIGVIFGPSGVAGYKIDPSTGALAPVPGSPVTAPVAFHITTTTKTPRAISCVTD
jgi:6-phosphogluconolactonase (cycloisomerase 2 family)